MTTLSGGSAARCDEMRVLLTGLVDGALDPESEKTIAQHLASCASCREARIEIEELSRGLRETRHSLPATPSWESVRRFVESKTHSPTSGSAQTWPAASLDGAFGRTARAHSDPLSWPPVEGHRGIRLARRPLVAAAAALLLATAGVLGGVWLRAARRGVPMDLPAMDTVSLTPEILGELLHPDRAPDFRRVGTARAVLEDQLAALSEEVAFTPIAPAALPGGYRFDQAWVITSKACRMICLRYGRDGKFVAILQSASGGVEVCALSNPRCCLLGGLACRKSRVDKVDVVQTTRGDVALTVAVPAGQTDLDSVMASLARKEPVRID